MKIAAAELRKRIEQGEDLEAISLSLIAPAEQGLLRGCAIVRTFDEKLVDDYFRPQVPSATKEAVPFTLLTSHDFVQRVPRSDGVYYLQPATQKKYYDGWWESSDVPRSEVPAALRELSVRLLEHYAALGDEGKLDVLAQQAFVDKNKACDLFEELYKAADTAFDLARCRDIIDVLTGFENVLGPDLARRLNDTNRYLQSRSLWATEYYQTVSYYDRKELSSELESFLTANTEPADESDVGKKWILHLHAPGGMGKTMFVRWLIARRCVPLPHTIPCGRVDFDFVNRSTANQHRWLLFLEIARELEVQIPGNYFHSLIGKFTDYERILNHQQSQQSTSTTTQLPPRDKLEEEMLYLFGNALRDAHLDEPVVLIFDTLEEVILYHPENLLDIVRQVNTLRKAFPDLLLVLSGRYDLTESGPDAVQRLPKFNEEFGAVTHTLRVKPFAKEEALGFLQLRGLSKDRPLDIIVERAEGNPFKLALFADILLDDPEITADTIRSYPSADLLYLIERVLARIQNKTLHWLLRYGVVPRKLTSSFVEEVMKKHLLRAISGEDQLDVPSRYQHLTPKVQAKVREKQIFIKAPVQDLNLDELWKDLQNYASKFAWVTMDASDPNIVSFHGDVVNPMRRWLEEEPVYKLLHQDAIAHFEKKAQDDPKNWGQWMSNAVYHKFQLEGSAAADYWRGLVVNEQDPARRHELASEVSGSEYVDDELRPRQLRSREQIISVATLAEAYYELARASVDMARAQKAAAGDQLWSEAERDLQTCERLQQQLAKPLVPPISMSLLRSSILITQSHIEQAIPILEEALKQNPDGYERVRLELNLAQAFSLHGDYQRAISYAESSAEGLDRFDITGVLAVAVRRNLAQVHRELGDLEASAVQLRKALDSVPQNDQGIRSELLEELRNVYFEMGRFSRAKETFDKNDAVIDDTKSLIRELRYLNHLVRFYLAVEDPQKALFITHDINGFMRSDFLRDATGESKNSLNLLVTRAIEQHGMLRSVLLEIEHARNQLEAARGRWHELGASKAVKRCMLKKAELFLNAGEINEARSILDEATRLSIEPDPEQALEETLLHASISHYGSQQDRENADSDYLYESAVQGNWGPHLRAKLILHAGVLRSSAITGEEASQFFSSLTESLRQISPVSARMLLLEPLSKFQSCRGIDYQITQELIDLFPLSPSDDDFNVHAPKLAELLRVLGRKDQAAALLKDLIKNDKGNNSFGLRKVFLALNRTSRTRGKMSDLKTFLETFLSDYEPFPVLCAATLIELAEESSATRSNSDRLLLLDQAEEFLKRDKNESQWTARLLALRGRLSIKEQRDEAHNMLARAIGIHETLGNNLAARKLKRFVAREQPPESSLASGVDIQASESLTKEDEAPKTTIHIESNWTDSVTINTTLPGEEVTTRRLPIEPTSLLDQILAFDTYENYSFSFLRSMDENWTAACYGMGQILLEEKLGQKLRELAVDLTQKSALCLIIDALQLSSAPWELMVIPPQSDSPASLFPALNFFYRSLGKPNLRSSIDFTWLRSTLPELGDARILAETVHGRLTEEAIRYFQRENRLPTHGQLDGLTRRTIKRVLHAFNGRERPRVLLLRPGIERQRATSRGDEIYGFSLEDWYSRAGFRDLVVVEDPHVASVQEILSTFEPDVVHVCPTMEESPSIGIVLEFGSGGTGVMPKRNVKSAKARQRADAPSREMQFLTLSALAELMKGQQRPDRARPLLILDVLEPAGRTELFTQLFLRNAFAAQLYELGAFESIIATGLTPPELREDMLGTLISAIGEFESVGETVNRIRRLVDLGSYTRLPPVGDNLGPLRDPADNNYLSKVIATAGTALFTPDPEM
jgi:cellulose synthase operon protein C